MMIARPLSLRAAARTSEPDHFNMFLVGTVWADQNGDNFYDEGEGLSGVLVVPDSGTYYAQTGIAGGFAIPITVSTTYTLTFSGGDLGDAVYTEMATVTGRKRTWEPIHLKWTAMVTSTPIKRRSMPAATHWLRAISLPPPASI